MFDIGWTEMAVVAVVALLVIPSKDIPKLLRTVGEWTGKARALAREFQGHLDDLARQSELDELKKQAEKVTSFDIKGEIANTIDPGGEIRKTVEEAGQAAEVDPVKLLGPEAPVQPSVTAETTPVIEAPGASMAPHAEERKA